MGKKFVEDDAKFAKSGFADLKKVRGLVVDIDVKPAPPEWETEYENLMISLEDAVGLETFSGEAPMEFKDGKYNFSYKYAEPNKNPPESGVYKKVLYDSCKKMGKKPSDLIGTVTTFEKLPVMLFQHRPQKDDNGKPIPKGEDGKYPLVDVVVTNYFSIVPDEGADSENTKQAAREQLVGLGAKATRRKLLTEPQFKQFPEMREKLEEGMDALAEFLDMEVDEEGKLALPKETAKAKAKVEKEVAEEETEKPVKRTKKAVKK